MQAAIGYLRVSTREESRSGLGLAAQRQDIEAFALREGLSVNGWHQDVQMVLRPGPTAQLSPAA